MKTHVIHLMLLVLGLHLVNCPTLLSENESASNEKSEGTVRKFSYKPRVENAPEVRIDGHSRSVDMNSPSLYVLAPEHAGYTIKEKPALYWYQSKPANAKFEFAIVGDDKAEPIFTIGYAPANDTGIQSIRLSEHDIFLKKGIQYTWYVTIIPDSEHRTKDVFASGMIEYVAPPPRVAKSLMNRSKKDLAYILAEEGIWYDALDIISNLIASNPEETILRELRGELLDQGNLSDAAEYSRLN